MKKKIDEASIQLALDIYETLCDEDKEVAMRYAENSILGRKKENQQIFKKVKNESTSHKGSVKN